jgi:hypothetical protein
METAQDRQGDDIPRALAWIRRHLCCGWNHVFESLMRSGLIEVVNILSEDPAKMAFVEDKEMVQALAADTAKSAQLSTADPGKMGSEEFGGAPQDRMAPCTLTPISGPQTRSS